MVTGPSKLREQQKPPNSSIGRYALIGAVVILAALGAYAAFGRRPISKKAQTSKKTLTPIKQSLGKLYAEALKDLKKKKLPAAGSKFRQLANIDPNYRDAAEQTSAIADDLYEEALKDIEDGNYDEAKNKLKLTKAINPKNKKVDKKLKEIEDETSDGSDDSTNTDQPPPTGETPIQIPDGATPVSLLLSSIDGYQTLRTGWLNEPIEARGVYVPLSSEVRKEITRVLVTISRFDYDQLAKDRLQREKDIFPMESEDITINGHDAYTGIYDFSTMPDFYKLRPMASITWTRDNWFFSIRVVPIATPASEYKKGIARDTAVKLMY